MCCYYHFSVHHLYKHCGRTLEFTLFSIKMIKKTDVKYWLAIVQIKQDLCKNVVMISLNTNYEHECERILNNYNYFLQLRQLNCILIIDVFICHMPALPCSGWLCRWVSDLKLFLFWTAHTVEGQIQTGIPHSDVI